MKTKVVEKDGERKTRSKTGYELQQVNQTFDRPSCFVDTSSHLAPRSESEGREEERARGNGAGGSKRATRIDHPGSDQGFALSHGH